MRNKPQCRGQQIASTNTPAVDFDACGSPNPSIYSGEPLPYTLEADDRLYSSWQDSRALVRNLKSSTQVTKIGAVNITREPDRGVMTGEVDQSLRPLAQGDEVLGRERSTGLIAIRRTNR